MWKCKCYHCDIAALFNAKKTTGNILVYLYENNDISHLKLASANFEGKRRLKFKCKSPFFWHLPFGYKLVHKTLRLIVWSDLISKLIFNLSIAEAEPISYLEIDQALDGAE